MKTNVLFGVVSIIIVMGVSTGFAVPAQQYVGYTNNFTLDSNGQAYWDLTGSEVVSFVHPDWKQQSWTYNDNYTNSTDGSYTLVNSVVERNTGIGGVVYHLQSSTSTPMDLEIFVNYYFGNWGGHVFRLYFSDENDWSNLSGMIGGTWDSQETNPEWTELYANRVWGTGGSGAITKSATTSDGDFYIRVDYGTTDGAGPQFGKFIYAATSAGIGMSVTGTKRPTGTVIVIK